MRVLIVGSLASELGQAARIAMARGAEVVHADDVAAALPRIRTDAALDLALCDVRADLAGLVRGLAAERIALPVVACGTNADAHAAVRAIRDGAREFLPLPPDPDLIAAILDSASADTHALIMRDPVTLAIAARAEQVAGSEASVLITGETGTGKEVFARHIHRRSRRNGGSFIALNCAAIPEQLLESELFGHEKGAFSGALARRVGKFEAADRGTLLLDEIGEMDLHLQAKLLRAVQEREIDRVGGSRAGEDQHPPARHHQPRPRRRSRATENSARICTSGSTSSRCASRRCASGRATSRRWPSISPGATPPSTGCRSDRSPRRAAAAARAQLARQCARAGERDPSRRAARARQTIDADAIELDRELAPPDGPALLPAGSLHAGVASLVGRTRGRGRARPDPDTLQPLPGQPHARRHHPRHLHPDAAQQAERIRRRGSAPCRRTARRGCRLIVRVARRTPARRCRRACAAAERRAPIRARVRRRRLLAVLVAADAAVRCSISACRSRSRRGADPDGRDLHAAAARLHLLPDACC